MGKSSLSKNKNQQTKKKKETETEYKKKKEKKKYGSLGNYIKPLSLWQCDFEWKILIIKTKDV